MIQDCECIVLVMYVVCGFVVVNDLECLHSMIDNVALEMRTLLILFSLSFSLSLSVCLSLSLPPLSVSLSVSLIKLF